MDLGRIIVRMAYWFRRPPSLQRIIILAVVIAVGLAIVAVEKAGYWPDALTLDKPPREMRLPRFGQ